MNKIKGQFFHTSIRGSHVFLLHCPLCSLGAALLKTEEVVEGDAATGVGEGEDNRVHPIHRYWADTFCEGRESY